MNIRIKIATPVATYWIAVNKHDGKIRREQQRKDAHILHRVPDTMAFIRQHNLGNAQLWFDGQNKPCIL